MRLLLWTILAACLSALLAGLAATVLLRESIPIIGMWVGLELTQNPGVAFGIQLPAMVQFAAIAGAFGVVVFMALRGRQRAMDRVAFGLIIGGALANLIDRLPDGVVTDFVVVRYFSVFNLADTWITVGAALLLLDILWERRRTRLASVPPSMTEVNDEVHE